MNYFQVIFTIEPFEEYIIDVFISELAEIGYESFVMLDKGFEAYISSELFQESKVEKLITNFAFKTNINYNISEIKAQNWNEEWEKNYFQPIVIDNRCVIHSSFHHEVPDLEYNIVIDPKMSFGTGHHETTSLMIAELLQMNVFEKSLLDMGCGTGVLAVLAAMRGAKKITAIDIDEWCVRNSIENIELNKVDGIEIKQGGAEILEGLEFDFILANINRNILLTDMQKYAGCLSSGGFLYMSGFYQVDIPIIEKEAVKNGLKLLYFKEKNNWAVVKTVKL